MTSRRFLALRGSRAFQPLFVKGRTIKTPHFLIKYVKQDGDEVRVGVIVTKKVAPKAVQRNRVKRQVRECMRSIADFFVGGADVVVTPLTSAVTFGEMRAEIASYLKKADLLRRSPS